MYFQSLITFLAITQLARISCNPTSTHNPEPLLATSTFDRNFNFHNKDLFLKAFIRRLIECIEPGDPSIGALVLPENVTRSKKNVNGTPAFVFEYKGHRKYNETCLGDTYKKDLTIRLHDAACYPYTEKINFLNLVSCNSDQNLECRQVGVEANRLFAEQATPIMRCLCPDFNKSQAWIKDRAVGYFAWSRNKCVLTAGRKCLFEKKDIKSLDQRPEWKDLEYDDDKGIQVYDLRPMSFKYPCVNNAFCYTGNSGGLEIKEENKGRCVCNAGYFIGEGSECEKGRETPSWLGYSLTVVMFAIGLFTFMFAAI